MPDTTTEDLLADFTPARPYTRDTLADAPNTPGVHTVLERGVVIYVGRTKNLRNRMRQHLTGDRQASVLHEQVGAQLDNLGPEATADDIAEWLGGCDIRWLETDNPEATKDSLILALKPRLNRQVPGQRRS
ncbi:GIY-YIG nuclease family protein [Micromonospora sp. NPDC048830]|uniref:GIY-YIG nuclease family protein n=1 Tax=Micromonospora sp. NPDC048830 TaxID=3364257 RepID=UPI00371FAEA6